MVNAQEYIEKYPNLVEVRLGNNRLLTSLSLGPSPRPHLTAIGFGGSGITEFSFLANLPNLHLLVLINNTQEHQAKVVRDINRAYQCKDQEIEKIKQQITQLQQQIQSLQTELKACEDNNRDQNSPPNLSSERNK
ncbi:3460_t:CDS:2 [Gigaspora margarita]|uniref:3460_t:CDS:1 n=1 Tax=Gigaspora margarita TaxID=4874 RepID=A0ABM8W3F1_GIGMA|nr:3460_t:CDS:2 [Gigaspora margarita]